MKPACHEHAIPGEPSRVSGRVSRQGCACHQPAAYAARLAAKSARRSAFTLVELLIVMTLMAIMAGLAIAFFPNAASSEREARAATSVQAWLNIAKQRAMRDQRPFGLRLWLKYPQWSATVTYKAGDFVERLGVIYQSSQANNSNQNPPAAPAFWNVTPVTEEYLPNIVVECQYIEQPDDFVAPKSGQPWSSTQSYTVGTIVSFNGAPFLCTQAHPATTTPPPANPLFWNRYGTMLAFGTGVTFNITQGELQNGYPSDPKYWIVQPDDYLEVLGTGMMHRITPIGFTATSFTVTPAFVHPISSPTVNYRILRAPRPVADEMLKLPNNTFIDVGTNATFGNTLPQSTTESGFYDILFAPNGSVISRGVTAGKLHLWVRSPKAQTPTDVFAGDPTLVSIFVRTGMVGAYKPDPALPAGSPYTFVK